MWLSIIKLNENFEITSRYSNDLLELFQGCNHFFLSSLVYDTKEITIFNSCNKTLSTKFIGIFTDMPSTVITTTITTIVSPIVTTIFTPIITILLDNYPEIKLLTTLTLTTIPSTISLLPTITTTPVLPMNTLFSQIYQKNK